MKGGELTQEMAVVVYVDQKLAETELDPVDILSKAVVGVKVDLVESGPIVIR